MSKFNVNNTFMNNFEGYLVNQASRNAALIVMPSINITEDNIHIINGYNPDELAKAISDVKASTK